MYAYVGSRTTRERNARGEGITVFKVDPRTEALERVQVVSGLVNPSYLILSADGRHLYAVHGDRQEISAFSVDSSTGTLSWLNTECTQGLNPVHLVFDALGRHLIVTNHLGASLAVLPVAEDGRLLPVTQLLKIDGPVGPHRVEQKQAKPHFALFDALGRHLIVPDKGLDRIFVFDYADGHLTPAAEPQVTAREGAGPRHAVLHPRGDVAYVVNELDSTVLACRLDVHSGALQPFQLSSALPDTFFGNSRAAGIAVDAAGRRLYVSNRGLDAIAVFDIAPESQRLRLLGATPTQGRTPRFFTLSPSGQLIYALNEDSDTITALRVNPQHGTLHNTDWSTPCGSPVCMVFSPAA